ncbi:MAG TPA: YceI family protein [Actinomycetota bacterium]|jgi:polyisoprenoid-binding protein YceI|nr:YceI family protein [Actinomycetota bacterium]
MAWTIDTAHTTVGFVARHMGLSKVRGTFNRFTGEVAGEPGDPTAARGRIEVFMDSVDTGNPDRDAHLKSADFFDVERFPTMVFEAKEVVPAGDLYKVRGDLTIKGIAKPVEFEYEHGGSGTDPYGNRKVGGTLTGTVNRRDWGLNWNVPLDTGGVLVSEKIKIEVDFQLAESQEAVEQEAQVEAEIS